MLLVWESISKEVHSYLPADLREQLCGGFANVWARFAKPFLDRTFESEYNSLKHGMRSQIGGFSVAIGPERTLGEPAGELFMLGKSEYGSS